MHYRSFNEYLRERFQAKVRRISLNASFACPNNGGMSKGGAGCIFCNELGFSEHAGTVLSLEEQIEESLISVRKKTGPSIVIAYFQNATNTNASVKELKSVYDVIRGYSEIAGLSISTRPDCIDDEKLDLIEGYMDDYEVWIEYGLQTVHDKTLEIIGRGHTFSQTVEAIKKTAARGIKTGVHVILGLPGESKDDMIETARKISLLPVSGVKLHVMHVLKNTRLAKLYFEGKVDLLTRNEYVGIACDFIENLRQDCVILRLASDARTEFLIAPEWMNKKIQVVRQIESEFKYRGTRQGSARGERL